MFSSGGKGVQLLHHRAAGLALNRSDGADAVTFGRDLGDERIPAGEPAEVSDVVPDIGGARLDLFDDADGHLPFLSLVSLVLIDWPEPRRRPALGRSATRPRRGDARPPAWAP